MRFVENALDWLNETSLFIAVHERTAARQKVMMHSREIYVLLLALEAAPRHEKALDRELRLNQLLCKIRYAMPRRYFKSLDRATYIHWMITKPNHHFSDVWSDVHAMVGSETKMLCPGQTRQILTRIAGEMASEKFTKFTIVDYVK